MGVGSNLYNFLKVLHIACVVLGFGAMAFNGFYLVHAHHQEPTARAAIIEANGDVSRIAEFLIYAVFLLGLLLVATSKSVWSFSQGWLSAAMVLYLVDIGILHGFIRRTQREYNALVEQVNGSAQPTAVGPPAQVAELGQLEQRISYGWIVFDAVFLVVVYLMVFKP